MASHPFQLLEVFAETPGTGNLLPVVLDADELTDKSMARVARRMKQSETSFVQAATDPAASYRHRIWTVAEELPFAGHPSVGTAVAVAIARNVETSELIQQTVSGLHSLSVRLAPDRRSGHAALRQPPLEIGSVVDAIPLMRAYGLVAADAHTELPAQLVSTGLSSLVVPLRAVEALGRVRMDPAAVEAAVAGLASAGVDAHKPLNCYFVAPVDETTWRARCLALDFAGFEDPATGSAAGPFGAWLAHLGGPSRITVLQGVEMGDPSRIEVDATDGIVIRGRVLVRAVGTIEL